jgi:hypothetical protein
MNNDMNNGIQNDIHYDIRSYHQLDFLGSNDNDDPMIIMIQLNYSLNMKYDHT